MTNDKYDQIIATIEAISKILVELPWSTRMTVCSALVANELRALCEGADCHPIDIIWMFNRSLEIALRDEQTSGEHLN